MIFRLYIFNFQNLLIVTCFLNSSNVRATTAELSKKRIRRIIRGGGVTDHFNLGKYVVSIQLNIRLADEFGWHHFCGGSIIGKRKILTAAHCLKRQNGHRRKPREIIVLVGQNNRFKPSKSTRVHKVERIVGHEDFGQESTLYADVGLIVLKNDILLDSDSVGIIELPHEPPIIGQRCTAMGWGKLFENGPSSDSLGFVDLAIQNHSECQSLFHWQYTPGMLCVSDTEALGKDACKGDSGGPLICDGKVVGIVSWGYGCGRINYPGVYTDVHYFKRWIESKGHMFCGDSLFVFIILGVSVLAMNVHVSSRLF